MIEKLLKVAGVPDQRIQTFAPIYAQRFEEYGLVEPIVQVHYFAQVLHESGLLRWMKEIWGPTDAQKRYERDFKKPWNKNQLAFRLGNSVKGDGIRYMGRGDLQTTGRDNYVRLSKSTGIDFLNNPSLLEQPQYAVLSGVEYWNRHSLTRIAAGDDRATERIFDEKRETAVEVNRALYYITKKVNGGYNGLMSRNHLYNLMVSEIPLFPGSDEPQ